MSGCPLAMFPPTSGKFHVLYSGSYYCKEWFKMSLVVLGPHHLSKRRKKTKTKQSGNQADATCKDNSASPGRILRPAPPPWIMQWGLACAVQQKFSSLKYFKHTLNFMHQVNRIKPQDWTGKLHPRIVECLAVEQAVLQSHYLWVAAFKCSKHCSAAE